MQLGQSSMHLIQLAYQELSQVQRDVLITGRWEVEDPSINPPITRRSVTEGGRAWDDVNMIKSAHQTVFQLIQHTHAHTHTHTLTHTHVCRHTHTHTLTHSSMHTHTDTHPATGRTPPRSVSDQRGREQDAL